MRRFLSTKAYWVAGTLAVIFIVALLLRPNQGVKFPDGSTLTVVYSRYDDWHPIVYRKAGYAICQIVPRRVLGEVNRFCRRVFGLGFYFGEMKERANLWQVELLLSGIDPTRDHPLLSGIAPTSKPKLRPVLVGTDGRRYEEPGQIIVFRAPYRRLILMIQLEDHPMDHKVTIQIWKDGGTNAVCSIVVRNPIRGLKLGR